jgi:hypothetical protein
MSLSTVSAASAESVEAFQRAQPIAQPVAIPLLSACVAEAVGPFGLVFRGCGAIMVTTPHP